MPMKSRKNKSIVLLGLVGAASLSHAQGTLLINFGDTTAGSVGSGAVTTAVAADFQGADGNVDGAANVNNVSRENRQGLIPDNSGDGFVGGGTGTNFNEGPAVLTGVGIGGEVFFTGVNNDFAPSDTSFFGTDAIYDNYIFGQGDQNGFGNIVATIDNLTGINAGDEVTVTIYSAGDNADQNNVIDLFYNGSFLGAQSTFTGDVGVDTIVGGALLTIEDTYAQFTFTYVDGVDTFDFVIDPISADGLSATGTTNAALNGLSITVVPEPGTYALLAGVLALGSVILRRRK